MGDSRETPSSCLFVSDLPSDITEKVGVETATKKQKTVCLDLFFSEATRLL